MLNPPGYLMTRICYKIRHGWCAALVITSLVTVSLVNIIVHKDARAQASRPAVSRALASGHINLSMAMGKSRVYKFNDQIVRLSVADPAVADVVLVNEREVYLLGKKNGVTNVFIWHENDRMSVIDLNIETDISAIQNVMEKLLPGEHNLRVTAAGESVALSGQLSSAAKVQQAVMVAEQMTGKKVMNMTTTDFLPQVLIEVKIAEIDKTVADQLGLQLSGSDFAFSAGGLAALGANATAAFSSGNTKGWIQAQVNSGLVKILAEPNIMAISGQEGNFLAGGIVFIPIPQSSATGGGAVITLQQQPYGVGLKFTPTVLDGNRINLVVKPEVSEVSPQGIPVSSGGTQIVMPVIMTRAASTTVQLMDGQTFAIGGLISNNMTQSISAFPWLGSIPILGALFRSNSFQSNRTELIILVTPHLVNPLNGRPKLPTDDFVPPTEFEFFGEGKLEGKKPVPTTTATSSQNSNATGIPAQGLTVMRDYSY
ncbi:MAG: type II and III secretion system protein family protein [Sheuella sp.]|nr:type II and III secretion system protein family protein [Sheuella sp.]